MKQLGLFFALVCSFTLLSMQNEQEERGLSASGNGSSHMLNDSIAKKHPSLENLRRSREKFEIQIDAKRPSQETLDKMQARRKAEEESKKKAEEESKKKK